MTVTIVIPLFNEQESVETLHQKLTEVMSECGYEYEVIYVDDGSTDGTLGLLESINKNDKNVVVLSLRRNFGQAAAFAAGFDFARGNIVVTMDGDLQNDPNDIPRVLDAMQDYDLVSGWRKYRKDPLIMRRIPSIVANWLISQVTGVRLHDYGCSLKAYRRDVVKNLKLYGEMHRFIPAVASWYGVRIGEIVIAHHPRLKGKSKYGIYKTIKVLFDLITVKFLQSFSTKPIQFFGPIGGFFGLTGLCISAYLTIQKLFFDADIGSRSLLLLGALLIIVGVQFIGMGLLGEMLVRVYHESQKKPIYTIKKMLSSSG
ncbi:MAG: glycosyltransferase family 2 protein [Nitrospirae bacterium]|nr:glycosyltransferase family 2 protein [Nitrospirota bacterium]